MSIITTGNWLVYYTIDPTFLPSYFNRSFWSIRDADLFLVLKFLVLNEEPSRCRPILTSPIGLNFIAWNGANRGDAKYYHTSHPRWSWHWRAALFLTFQKLLTWCWQKKFPSYSIVHKMRYFDMEIFSGWSLCIYSFLRKLDCWSGNIFGYCLGPCFTVACLLWQAIWYYFYEFWRVPKDSELIYVTILNVTKMWKCFTTRKNCFTYWNCW